MKKYIYNGIIGFLAYSDELKEIKPIVQQGNVGFYPESVYYQCSNQIETLFSYDDCYYNSLDTNEIQELVTESVVNIENPQKLLHNVFVTKEYWEQDYLERMILTETDQYYDWISERTAMKRLIEQNKNNRLQELRAKWEQILSGYKNTDDTMNFENLFNLSKNDK